MKYQKECDLINELVILAQIIPSTFESREPHMYFGIGKANISFIGFQSINKYRQTTEELYSSNKEIYETLTLKKFEESVIELIRVLKNKGNKCTPDDFIKIISDLLKIEVEESEILYSFYGATIKSSSISFGDFTIYDKEKSFDFLVLKYPYLQLREIYFDNLNSQLIIGVKVKARENAKAVALADKLCESFENVFSYALGDLTHLRRIGILNFRGWSSISKVVCNNNSMGYDGKNDHFLQVNLDDPFFKDGSQGNDKIWHLITKKDKNPIEIRLLNAIEWIGKAAYDRDRSKALVQFVFAIEGMLQLNEKDFITSSIVSQLSDWLAFIIDDEPEKRKEIAKYFKDIYRKRSTIAHGGSTTIEIEDLAIANQIAKLMVITFLTTDPYKEMTSMNQLNLHMTDLKFK